jgi:CheY-like chemotaxis protein
MEWGRSRGDTVPAGVSAGEVDMSAGEVDMPAGEVDVPAGEPVEPNRSGGRVLVCDDTEQIRRLIRLNLELEGYEVVEAVDGLAALELLQDPAQALPDVITVDVVMPRRDGWWTVSQIRSDPRLAHIPIVLVTASAQDVDRAHAERAEVDEFVAKPFDPEELLTKIEALADGHRPRGGAGPLGAGPQLGSRGDPRTARACHP